MQKHDKKEPQGKALEQRNHSGNHCSKTISPFAGKRYILFFVLSIVILTGMGWYAWSSFERLDKFQSQKDEMAELRGTILHFDEVLTMSARMAAATGDLKWENRYRTFEPQLDDAIKKAKKLAPRDFMSRAAGQTDTANIKLVAMENESFDLVRQRNLQAATKLLYSQEYEKQKHLYKEGMGQYITALRNHIKNENNKIRRTVFIFIAFLVFTFSLAVFGCISILQMRKHLTERKKAEDALLRSEEKFRTLVEQLPSITYTATLDEISTTLYISPQIEKILGISPEKYKTNPDFWSEHLHDEDRERVFEEVNRTHESGQPLVSEYRMLSTDGRIVWFRDEAVIIKDSEGTPLYLQGVMYDITERKQAEEVLRESEEKVRTLYDSSSDAIMLLDEKSFFDCNDATLRLFGCASREEFCSRHPADFSPPTQPCGTDSLTLANQRIATAMQTGLNRFEWMHKRIDSDEAFPADVLLDAMELGGKKVLQARVYDITERKQAEGELERLNKQLESAVKELSIANRELKDFAHITAHDLKAPLRGIGTLAEWLATDYADKFDEEGKKQVGLLVQRSQEMYNQITGILQFSEIGQGTHECERIDLNGLIKTIITSVNPPENIQITIADKLPTLVCAQVHLTQVFQNLLSNAIKYTDKPDVRITIGCVEENGLWKFSVADNGPGIEEKYFDKIFQIFQTLPVEGEHRSTGIGLAIVRKAVEMYGGKIWLKSAPGQGTTFFFTFPKQEMKVACDEKLEANIVG